VQDTFSDFPGVVHTYVLSEGKPSSSVDSAVVRVPFVLWVHFLYIWLLQYHFLYGCCCMHMSLLASHLARMIAWIEHVVIHIPMGPICTPRACMHRWGYMYPQGIHVFPGPTRTNEAYTHQWGLHIPMRPTHTNEAYMYP